MDEWMNETNPDSDIEKSGTPGMRKISGGMASVNHFCWWLGRIKQQPIIKDDGLHTWTGRGV